MPAPKPSFPRLQRGHPLAQGVVGAWPMYEGSGLTVNDVSGRGKSGTLSGTLPTWVGGQSGWVLNYGGSGYTNVAGFPDQAGASFSVGLWQKSTDSTSSHTVASKFDGARGWLLYNGSASNVSFDIEGTGQHQIDWTYSNFYDGNWHRIWIVGLWGGSNYSNMYIYVDGVQKSTGAGAFGSNMSNAGALVFAGRAGGTSLWTGQQDAPVIYNRALSAAEIEADYADSFAMYRRRSWRLAGAAGVVATQQQLSLMGCGV